MLSFRCVWSDICFSAAHWSPPDLIGRRINSHIKKGMDGQKGQEIAAGALQKAEVAEAVGEMLRQIGAGRAIKSFPERYLAADEGKTGNGQIGKCRINQGDQEIPSRVDRQDEQNSCQQQDRQDERGCAHADCADPKIPPPL